MRHEKGNSRKSIRRKLVLVLDDLRVVLFYMARLKRPKGAKMGLFDKAKEAHKQKQVEKARLAAAEEARKQKILNGEFAPITVKTTLQPNETAYLELTARRMATRDSVVQETVGKSKKKHPIRRAVVGGVLLGPLGAVGGAATAGSKQTSTTTERTVSTIEQVDSGQMILTDQRFIFLGNNDTVISLPYAEITATNINDNIVSVKYAGMLNREYYEVFGENANDIELYYKGITQHKAVQSKPTAAPKALQAQHSVADELTKLAKLKAAGVITQAEFDKQKVNLLS